MGSYQGSINQNHYLTLLTRLLAIVLARDVSRRRHLMTARGHCSRVTPCVIHRQTRRMHHATGTRMTSTAYTRLTRLAAMGDVGLH